jgi:hypothetical protein
VCSCRAVAKLGDVRAPGARCSAVCGSGRELVCLQCSRMSRRRSPNPRSVVDLANASSFEERTRLIEADQARRRAPARSPPPPRRRSVWVDGASFDEAALVGKRVRLLDGSDFEGGLAGHIEGRVASWKGPTGRFSSKGGYDLQLDDGTRLKNIKLAHASCQHKSAHRFEVFQAVRGPTASRSVRARRCIVQRR